MEKKNILQKMAATIERKEVVDNQPIPESKSDYNRPRTLTEIYIDGDDVQGDFNPEVGSTIKGKFQAIVKGVTIREREGQKNKSIDLGITKLITGK